MLCPARIEKGLSLHSPPKNNGSRLFSESAAVVLMDGENDNTVRFRTIQKGVFSPVSYFFLCKPGLSSSPINDTRNGSSEVRDILF